MKCLLAARLVATDAPTRPPRRRRPRLTSRTSRARRRRPRGRTMETGQQLGGARRRRHAPPEQARLSAAQTQAIAQPPRPPTRLPSATCWQAARGLSLGQLRERCAKVIADADPRPRRHPQPAAAPPAGPPLLDARRVPPPASAVDRRRPRRDRRDAERDRRRAVQGRPEERRNASLVRPTSPTPIVEMARRARGGAGGKAVADVHRGDPGRPRRARARTSRRRRGLRDRWDRPGAGRGRARAARRSRAEAGAHARGRRAQRHEPRPRARPLRRRSRCSGSNRRCSVERCGRRGAPRGRPHHRRGVRDDAGTHASTSSTDCATSTTTRRPTTGGASCRARASDRWCRQSIRRHPNHCTSPSPHEPTGQTAMTDVRQGAVRRPARLPRFDEYDDVEPDINDHRFRTPDDVREWIRRTS